MRKNVSVLLSIFLIISLFTTGCLKKKEPKYFVNVTISVKDLDTDKPITEANVMSSNGKTGTTDKTGSIVFNNMEGNKNYSFTIKAGEYQENKFSLNVKTESVTHTVLLSKYKGSIVGIIVDNNETTIEGAVISIPNTSLNAHSQGDGSFAIIDVPVSKTAYTLDVSKDAFSSRKIYNIFITTDKPNYNAGKIILANDPGRLTGNVTDQNGEPLSSVSVFIKEANKTVTTNNQGFFIVEVLPGTYTITFSNQYYKTVIQNAVEIKSNKDTSLNVQLSPKPGSISGTIKDTKENVLENVLVTVLGTSFLSTSDATGYFYIEDIPPGSYTVQFSNNLYKTKTVSARVEKAKETTISNINLDPKTGSIIGRVIDQADNSPIQGAIVRSNTTSDSITTMTDGSFQLTNIRIGLHTLNVSATDYSKAELVVNVEEEKILTIPDVKIFKNPGSIYGTVIDSISQKALENVTVTLIENTSMSAKTDSQGIFTIGNLLSNVYSIKLDYDNYYSKTISNISVEPLQARNVGTIDLEPKPCTIQGTTTPGATAKLRGTSYSTTALSTGRFILNNVPPKDYVLDITKDNYTSRSENISLVPAQSLELGILTLESLKGSITGTVRDKITQQIMSDVDVSIIEIPTINVKTNAQGIFRLDNLEVGTYSLKFSYLNYISQNKSSVGVVALQTNNIGIIDLEPKSCSIQGTTTPGATVKLQSTSYYTTASDTGQFIINNIIPGNYILEITKTNYSPMSRSITLTPAQKMDLGNIPLSALKGSITGTVRDSITLGVMANVTVTLLDNPTVSGKTDTKGVFRLDNLEVGTYSLKFDYTNYITQNISSVYVEALKTTNMGFINLVPRPCIVKGTTTPGATVNLRSTYYSGTANGAGAFVIDNIQPGSYTVDISLTNYNSKAIPITLIANETKDLGNQKLTPLPGKITGLTNASTVTIVENNKSVSVVNNTFTIDNLTPGTYTLKYTKSGYISQTKIVVVTPNGTTNAGNVSLEPNTGAITGYIECSGGNITVVETKETQFYNNPAYFTFSNLMPGTYHLTLEKQDYQAKFYTVTVNPGQTTDMGNIIVNNKLPGLDGEDITEYIADYIFSSSKVEMTFYVNYEQPINFTGASGSIPMVTYKLTIYVNGIKKYEKDLGKEKPFDFNFTGYGTIKVVSSFTDYTAKYYADSKLPKIDINRTWYLGNASVIATCEDNHSGLKAVEYSLSTSPTTPGTYQTIVNGSTITISNKGVWYLHIRATDKAGNISTRIEGPYIIP